MNGVLQNRIDACRCLREVSRANLRANFRGPGAGGGLAVEFDDEVHVHIEGHLIVRGHRVDLGGERRRVEAQPAGNVVAGQGFHGFADEALGFGFDGQAVAGLDAVGRSVDLTAVDQHVTVGDDLACGPNRTSPTQAADDVVQAFFEKLEEKEMRQEVPGEASEIEWMRKRHKEEMLEMRRNVARLNEEVQDGDAKIHN